MLQDQLRVVLRAAPDPHMEGFPSSDPTAGRGGGGMSSRPSKPTATMQAMMSQDQRPAGAVPTPAAPAAGAAPQQLALKCPRCDSSNTKFCYYNNYSQTQPRHFCKSCRRYWTQGGSLRNVPVGGGCRKNKRVKPRSLVNLSSGAAAHIGGHYGPASALLDPNYSLLFDDDSASLHMQQLARLGGLGAGYGAHPGGGASPDFNTNGEDQLLNIAFSRFQESMRHRQLATGASAEASPDHNIQAPPAVVPFFDMGFSSLPNHKPCPGLENHHMGYTAALDQRGDGTFCNPNSYEVNPNFHSMNDGSTSATATLASIEDQLSTFSVSLQAHHRLHGAAHDQPFDGVAHEEEQRSSVPLQLLQQLAGHGGAGGHHSASNMGGDQERHHGMNTELPDDSNWQQPTFMNHEMLLEAHNHHSHNNLSSATSRWQEMMYSLTTPAATAGGVL